MLRQTLEETPAATSARATITARAVLLGERLDTRGLARDEAIGTSPLALRVGSSGTAFVFRYGVVVLFGASSGEADALIASLLERTSGRLDRPETDQAVLALRPDVEETVDAAGTLHLKDAAPERLLLVAHILSKSLVLAHYEAKIAGVFDQIEPLAESLQRSGRTGSRAAQLLQQIGYVLITQHRMVGRVEVEEKPEILWENPQLERLYARLEDEYELSERSRALERKLQLINETVGTLLELAQDKRSLRVEWYIVILICVEIGLSVYEIFIRGH